tara:strand:+ start:1762 stop:2877 length:1116 start_codon:yes stop_codon:yes gene_type:complete
MKNIRRVHLYLGCFFTPLLFLYILTGFVLTLEKPGTLKSGSDAESFLQKLSTLHQDQYYPMRIEGLVTAELKSVDPAKDTITTTTPHNYPDGTPVNLTGIGLPGGLNDQTVYYVRVLSPNTLTLHSKADTKPPIDLLNPLGKNIQLNPAGSGHNSTRIIGFDPGTDTVTTETAHDYPEGLEISRISGIDLPPGLKGGFQTYFVKPTGEKTLTLHESPDNKSPVDLTAFPNTFKNVFFNPAVRPVVTNNTTGFKWLVYVMSLGVLATMALGVVLAFRVAKDKGPVWISLAAGFIIPILLLWLGTGRGTIANENASNPPPEPPGKNTPTKNTIPAPPAPGEKPPALPGEIGPANPKGLPPELPKGLLPEIPPK